MKLPLQVLPLLLVLSVPARLWAQNPDNPMTAPAQNATVAAPKPVPRPVRRPDQVVTDDPIGLMAVRRAPRLVSAPPLESVTTTADASGAADAEGKRAEEIVFLEKQIKDKQKQIGLLMKLFVDDEKEFLKNGGAAEANPITQERRRYEQDELRWETAELAKLQARVEQLKNETGK